MSSDALTLKAQNLDHASLVIVGTDAGVGKTYNGCVLLRLWQQQGIRAQGIKPIASGCTTTPAGLRNDDDLLLQQSIFNSGAPLVGWIANQSQPVQMDKQAENIEFLQDRLQTPLLGCCLIWAICWSVIDAVTICELVYCLCCSTLKGIELLL